MTKSTLLSLFLAVAAPAVALAQDAPPVYADLQGTRTFAALDQDERGPRGRGGQVTEEWYTPHLRGSLSFWGRASFPGDTDVTTDHIFYSDLFDVGLGLSVEADLLMYVAPHVGIGPYISVGWDRFDGQTIHFSVGDEATPDRMDLTTVLLGAKFFQRISPFATWEGRIGAGFVHYSAVNWSGIDTGVPFSNEQLFSAITRFAFEIGGRFGFGGKHIEADLGFGLRYMGPAERGKDVTNVVDPEILFTFMIELGLTVRF